VKLAQALRALLPVLPVLLACGDGGSSEAGATSSGGHGGAGSSSGPTGPGSVSASSASSSTGGGGINPDDPYGCVIGQIPSAPPSIPEGWRPWTCWDSQRHCTLWIPEDPETMMDPLEWEPCSPGVPVDDGCQQLKRTWDSGGEPKIGDVFPAIPELDLLGSTRFLRLARTSITAQGSPDSYAEWTVYELDGPGRMALRLPVLEPVECGYQENDLSEGFWILAPKGHNTVPISESPHDGAMLIDVASRQVTLPYRDDQPGGSAWRVGAMRLTQYSGGTLYLHDHAFTEQITLQAPGQDPLGAAATSNVNILGDAVVWEVTTSSTVGIRAYDPVLGPHDLVRYLDDPTRGAGTPATDGVDLVWMEGSGRDRNDVTYPVRDVMTSPFTTDPAALRPRRLRSDPSESFGASGSEFEIGCGRAAKDGVSPKDVQIVRLTDGQAWRLEHTQQLWHASTIVGLTCDEIFLVVQTWVDGEPQGSTLQRIRFDALGEGIPPD
jgi:hypothetical protein